MNQICTKDLGAAPTGYLAGYSPDAMQRALHRCYNVRSPDEPPPADLETLVDLGRKQLAELKRILALAGQTPPAE